jgi:hypothetical protein
MLKCRGLTRARFSRTQIRHNSQPRIPTCAGNLETQHISFRTTFTETCTAIFNDNKINATSHEVRCPVMHMVINGYPMLSSGPMEVRLLKLSAHYQDRAAHPTIEPRNCELIFQIKV